MALSERLAFVLSLDADGAVRGFQKVGKEADRHLGKAEDRLDRVGSRMTKFGAGAVAASGVAAVGLFKLSQNASDLEESVSKVNVVFGENAKEIQDWSRKSAKAFGQSRQSALEAVGTYGNLFQAFGVGRQESTKMSKSLVELAADLASFNNTSVEDALNALRSGLSGETEPMKRYGAVLSDVRLKTEALTLGIVTNTKDALSPAAKAQAAYSLIMKDTTLAQGDFARTSDGAANQQRILAAQLEDLRANIGMGVLPVVKELTGGLNDIAGKFNSLSPEVQAGAGRMAAYGTAALGAVGALSFLGGQAIKLRDRFSTLTEVNGRQIRSLNNLGAAAGVLGAAGAMFALAGMLDSVINKSKSMAETVDDLSRKTGRDLVAGFEDAARSVRGLPQSLEDVSDEFRKLAESGEQGLGSAIRLRDEYAAMGRDVSTLDTIIEDVTRRQVTANRAADAGSDAVKKYADATGEATDEVEFQADAEAELAARLKDAATASDEATKATERRTDAAIAAIDADLAYRGAAFSVADADDAVAKARDALTGATGRSSSAGRSAADVARDQERAARSLEDALLRQSEAEKTVTERQQDLADATENLNRVLNGYGADSEEATSAEEDRDTAMRRSESAALDVADAEDRLARALAEFGSDSREYKRATIGLADARDRQRDADRRLQDAEQKLIETIDGAAESSDAAKAATEKYEKAQDDLESANRRLLDATRAVTDAETARTTKLSSGGGAVRDRTELERDLEKALLDQERAYRDAAEKAAAKAEQDLIASGKTVTATEKIALQILELQKLRDTLGPGDPLRARLNGLIGELSAVPGVRLATIILDANTSLAEKRLAEFIQGIKKSGITDIGAISGIAATMFPVEARASGGPVKSGAPYVVGEEGPELFVPGASGQIVPNGAGTTGGMTGGAPVNITVNALDPAAAADAVIAAVRKYEQLNGTSWRS